MNTFSSISIPRLESLHHRLKTAKGADGKPLCLIDELMVLLEDPPAGVADRWQAGADFCAGHGVVASRVTVWRFYRAQVVEWRAEQVPLPPAKVAEKWTARLLEQARYLLARRAVESLNHPDLPPQVLVGLVHHENRRQELQLARDKFDDQLREKEAENTRRNRDRIWRDAQEEAKFSAKLRNQRQLIAAFTQKSTADTPARGAAPFVNSPDHDVADSSPASPPAQP